MWKPTNNPEVSSPGPSSRHFPPTPPIVPPHQSSAWEVQATAPELAAAEQHMPASQSKRVNVIFSAPQYQLLKSLAGRQGISVSDVLRQALSLTKLIVEANENPDERILVERKGQLQELKLVR
jgi:hypothetical protein